MIDSDDYKLLVSFPHILKRLEALWGSDECRQYLSGLLIPDRIDRKGFPFAVLSAIYSLLDLHDVTYPQFKPRSGLWDHDPKTYR